MQLTFRLCTGVVRIVTELVANCSARVGGSDSWGGGSSEAATDDDDGASFTSNADTRAHPADLHASHFLMPLLVRTLCCVRYSGLSVLQMQLAWYAAQKLATLVSAVVKQPPVPPPSMVLTKASSENLRLQEGLPVLMLHDEEERMAGGEGSLRLAIAMGGGGAEGNRAIVMGGDGDGGDDDGGASSAIDVAQRPIDFDGMSQRVLPFVTSLEEAEPALAAARTVVQSLRRLQELRAVATAAEHRLSTAALSTPHSSPLDDSDALAERLNEVLEVLGAAAPRLRDEVKEARRAITNAKRANFSERKALHDRLVAMPEREAEAEGRRVEARYAAQLARSCALDPAPVEAMEEELIEQLRQTGAAGTRIYAPGQELNVLVDGSWQDAVVVRPADGLMRPHYLRELIPDAPDGRTFELRLHPFNHGPRDVSSASFAALIKRHNRSLRNAHSGIVDALSGRRLNVFDQCVPIEIGAVAASRGEVSPLGDVTDVAGLAAWLQRTHAQRTGGAAVTACVLLSRRGPRRGRPASCRSW